MSAWPGCASALLPNWYGIKLFTALPPRNCSAQPSSHESSALAAALGAACGCAGRFVPRHQHYRQHVEPACASPRQHTHRGRGPRHGTRKCCNKQLEDRLEQTAAIETCLLVPWGLWFCFQHCRCSCTTPGSRCVAVCLLYCIPLLPHPLDHAIPDLTLPGRMSNPCTYYFCGCAMVHWQAESASFVWNYMFSLASGYSATAVSSGQTYDVQIPTTKFVFGFPASVQATVVDFCISIADVTALVGAVCCFETQWQRSREPVPVQPATIAIRLVCVCWHRCKPLLRVAFHLAAS